MFLAGVVLTEVVVAIVSVIALQWMSVKVRKMGRVRMGWRSRVSARRRGGSVGALTVARGVVKALLWI